MAERILNADRIEQLITAFGSFDENISRIEEAFGVRITARTKAGGVLNNPPGDITIETAKTITGDGMENDADWTYSERFTGTKPDEGIMSHSLHNSVYLGEIQRARYIRFTLHMSWNSGSSVKPTPMTYKGGTFAEFEVWGNLEELDLD